VLLLGGEPGIGKSTLALQILGNADTNALYVSSEETREQVLERAERIGLRNINVVSESDLGAVDLDNYGLICVDSLQTIRFGDMGAPGSPAMVKEIAGYLVNGKRIERHCTYCRTRYKGRRNSRPSHGGTYGRCGAVPRRRQN